MCYNIAIIKCFRKKVFIIFSLVKTNNGYYLLLNKGVRKLSNKKEIREHLFNYDLIDYEEISTPLSKGEEVNGQLIATLDDNNRLTIYRPKLVREILEETEEYLFYTPTEYAALYGRSRQVVVRYCREGKLNATKLSNGSWVIPKNTPYPKDGRAGRDMSNRYRNKTI